MCVWCISCGSVGWDALVLFPIQSFHYLSVPGGIFVEMALENCQHLYVLVCILLAKWVPDQAKHMLKLEFIFQVGIFTKSKDYTLMNFICTWWVGRREGFLFKGTVQNYDLAFPRKSSDDTRIPCYNHCRKGKGNGFSFSWFILFCVSFWLLRVQMKPQEF